MTPDSRRRYQKRKDHEFLFDVAVDQRERANQKARHPEVFASLRQAWETWNGGMLPIPPEAYTHGLTPAVQADRYVPDAPRALP